MICIIVIEVVVRNDVVIEKIQENKTQTKQNHNYALFYGRFWNH